MRGSWSVGACKRSCSSVSTRRTQTRSNSPTTVAVQVQRLKPTDTSKGLVSVSASKPSLIKWEVGLKGALLISLATSKRASTVCQGGVSVVTKKSTLWSGSTLFAKKIKTSTSIQRIAAGTIHLWRAIKFNLSSINRRVRNTWSSWLTRP